MLVTDRLTVKVTAKICEAEASAVQINSLEGSLMFEWVGISRGLSRSIEIYREINRHLVSTIATSRGVDQAPHWMRSLLNSRYCRFVARTRWCG